ncbi:MAG: hypothetical protein OEV23_00375 [Gallionella sp.]|nr:hypothetical protein [Gallionella sp.]
MAKLKSDQITKCDLLEYLNSYSDFSFELAVLKMLRERNIECDHGGHYEDPVTNKSREFDIRATKTINNLQAGTPNLRVRMAIECKNIRENFPILISCIPRHEQESHHQIAQVGIHKSRATMFSIRDSHSLYKKNEPVGKSTVQVGRAMDSTISSNDSELYEKWGQCLSSATDLVNLVYWDGRKDKAVYFSAVFPFVVVPNGRLWMVAYDEDGNRVCDPTPTDRISCFINKSYPMVADFAGATMQLSHVEIVTFDGMTAFVDKYLNSEMAEIFPKEGND